MFKELLNRLTTVFLKSFNFFKRISSGMLMDDFEYARDFLTGIIIDLEGRRVWKRGVEIKLNNLEFGLLRLFYENPNQSFTRSSLLEYIWSYNYFGDERIIEVTMKRLIKKLGQDIYQSR